MQEVHFVKHQQRHDAARLLSDQSLDPRLFTTLSVAEAHNWSISRLHTHMDDDSPSNRTAAGPEAWALTPLWSH